MIKSVVVALCAAAATFVSPLVGSCGFAQNSGGSWSAKDITARFTDHIDGGSFVGKGTLRPKPGFGLLEISGTFSAKSEPRSIFIDRVFLSAKGQKELRRIESIGPYTNGSCVHVFVGPLLSRDNWVDFGGEDKCLRFSVNANGVGAQRWAFCQEKEEVPLEVRLYRSSTPLCVAFAVPENWSGSFTLHFGDATVPVVVPAAKQAAHR